MTQSVIIQNATARPRKISVVVPCYNSQRTLPYTLNSLSHESNEDVKIILVNDGSSDNSLNIATNWARSRKNVTIVSQPNMGLSSARNTGIKYIDTPYMAFLDSDDLVTPHAHSFAAKKMALNGCQLGLLKSIIYNERYDKLIPFYDSEIFNGLQNNFGTGSWRFSSGKNIVKIEPQIGSKVFQTSFFNEAIKQFEPNLYFEDFPVLTKTLVADPQSILIPEKSFFYRIGSIGKITTSGGTRRLDGIKSMNLSLEILERSDKRSLFIEPFKQSALRFLLWNSRYIHGDLFQGYFKTLKQLITLHRITQGNSNSENYFAYLCKRGTQERLYRFLHNSKLPLGYHIFKAKKAIARALLFK